MKAQSSKLSWLVFIFRTACVQVFICYWTASLLQGPGKHTLSVDTDIETAAFMFISVLSILSSVLGKGSKEMPSKYNGNNWQPSPPTFPGSPCHDRHGLRFLKGLPNNCWVSQNSSLENTKNRTVLHHIKMSLNYIVL